MAPDWYKPPVIHAEIGRCPECGKAPILEGRFSEEEIAVAKRIMGHDVCGLCLQQARRRLWDRTTIPWLARKIQDMNFH